MLHSPPKSKFSSNTEERSSEAFAWRPKSNSAISRNITLVQHSLGAPSVLQENWSVRDYT